MGVGDWIQLIAGPVLSLISVIIWEQRLRPRRAIGIVAKTLLLEIGYHAEQLSRLPAWRAQHQGMIPADFALRPVAFDSIANSLGELPAEALHEVVQCYQAFADLNAMVTRYLELGERLEETQGAMPMFAKIYAAREQARSVFDQRYPQILAQARRTISALAALVPPRGWRGLLPSRFWYRYHLPPETDVSTSVAAPRT